MKYLLPTFAVQVPAGANGRGLLLLSIFSTFSLCQCVLQFKNCASALSRSTLEILKEGQNGYQTGVRVHSRVTDTAWLLSSIGNLLLYVVSVTKQWVMPVLNQVFVPSVRSEHVQFRTLEQNRSVRSVITIPDIENVNSFLPKIAAAHIFRFSSCNSCPTRACKMTWRKHVAIS